MMITRYLSCKCTVYLSFCLAAVIFLSLSCTVIVKNYPSQKPFVYKTNIVVTGLVSQDSADLLKTKLLNQLDDSLRAPVTRKLFPDGFFSMFTEGLNRRMLIKPHPYASQNADISVNYMKALLISLGYFYSTISYTTVIDTVRNDEYRATVNFTVDPGRLVTLDSIHYNMKQAELQRMTQENIKASLLKKGGPFSRNTISQELDRLVELYRDNGYLRFNRDMLQGVWDTLDVSFLRPDADPFEQIRLLENLKTRKDNPTANLEIRLKPGTDTGRLRKYYIGQVTVMPDYYYSNDTMNILHETRKDGLRILYHEDIFKPGIFPRNIYLKRGSLYSQQNYFNTINRFNSFGSWRLVDIEPQVRTAQDTVDFLIRLTPAKKLSGSLNLEGSYNQSAFSGNLAGFNINASLQNRNLWRGANQYFSSILFGVETGRDTATHVKFVQTRQVSFNHIFYFQKPLVIGKILDRIDTAFRLKTKTTIGFNATYTEKRNLFNLTTANASWGYNYTGKKSTLRVLFPNVEYSKLKPQPLLISLFDSTPSLKYIFTDGFILSTIINYTRQVAAAKHINLFRANMELSGLLTIHPNKFLDSNLYRFAKLDAEFTRKIGFKKSSVALRLFAGAGYELNSTHDPTKVNNLPFFKEYFAGGPNSMRAWALRKLGPGSTIKSFSDDPERFGDLQLEANVEYRFPLTTIWSVKLNGAIFTDIGNVWFVKNATGRPPEEVFSFSRLGKDIAIGTGLGIRADLSYFILRFDYSYKVKDPSPADASIQNKWFHNWQLLNGQFQLGIGYPFIL